MTNTTNEGPQLFAANELMGATLTANMSKSDRVAFASNSKSFISSSLNLDTGDISVSVVENDSATLHLALPYYADLERLSAEVLKDADIDDVAGGEIIISIGVAIGSLAAVSAAVAAGAAATAGGVAVAVAGAGLVAGGVAAAQAAEGKNLDGSKK